MRIVGGESRTSTSAPPAGLSVEQWENAKTIAQVGHQLGVGSRGIQIALMTALVESGLRDVSYGDRDSVGVFQQRSAWGSYQKRMNVAQSARMFFTGGEQGQRGLLDIHGWDQMDPGAAAQAVQVSAFPDRYSEQLGKSQRILEGLGRAGDPVTVPTGTYNGTSGDVPQHAPTGAPAGAPVGMPSQPSPTVITAPLGASPSQGTPNTFEPVNAATESPLTSAYEKLVEQTPQASSQGTAQGAGEATALGVQPSNEGQDLSQFSSSDPELDLTDLFNPTTVDQATYENLTSNTAPDAKVGGIRAAMLNYARSALGTPYKFGGNSPSQGLDCSGIVKWALNKAGVQGVPRLSHLQAAWSGDLNPRANDLSGARPGDLLTWGDGYGGPITDHIAIYVGNDQILEEPKPGESARIIKLGSYYRNLYGGFHVAKMGKIYGD